MENKIYSNKEKYFENQLNKVRTAKIKTKSKELIEQFSNYLFSKNSSKSRIAKLVSQLLKMSNILENELFINKSLDKITKNDLIGLVSSINKFRLSENTKADYRRCLKQFFHWFKDEDFRIYSKDENLKINTQKFYNYLEKEVRILYKVNKIDPSTIITEEDISIVLDKGCRTHRERAFIHLLHETGMRVGEFLNLRLKDIIFSKDYAIVQVPDGKTGRRTIYIYRSIPDLRKYLDVHPLKNDSNSFLWLSEAQHNYGKPIKHKGGQKLIDRCFKKSHVSKRHNYHWFRHSRASILAPNLTEVVLCKYMGWTIGSKMVRNYAHLCNNQLEDVFLKLHGIKTRDEIESPITCSVCGKLNNPSERYCYQCSRPLKVETLIQDQELVKTETGKTIEVLMEIMQNPDLKAKFESFKKSFV